MIQVTSKTVSALDYKPQEEKLLVRFNSGVWYEYLDVNAREYETIKNADSVGSTLRKVTASKQYRKLKI